LLGTKGYVVVVVVIVVNLLSVASYLPGIDLA
jgi:hypothetical protein